MSLDEPTLAAAPANISWTVLGQAEVMYRRPSQCTLQAAPDGLAVDVGLDTHHRVIASQDGATWSDVRTALPMDRDGLAGAALPGLYCVAGGSGNDGKFHNDVWTSTDGATWTLATAAAAWAPRSGHAMAAFNGRLWVMGGREPSGRRFDEIWSSADGQSWQLEVKGQVPSSVCKAAVVFGNQLYLFGENQAVATIFYSPDGRAWRGRRAPWSAREGARAVVLGSRIYFIGGTLGGSPQQQIWSSADGVTWTLISNGPPWTYAKGVGTAVFGGRIALFGGENGAGEGTRDILGLQA